MNTVLSARNREIRDSATVKISRGDTIQCSMKISGQRDSQGREQRDGESLRGTGAELGSPRTKEAIFTLKHKCALLVCTKLQRIRQRGRV